MAGTIRKLTDDEGAFLALLVRVQPATAYQLSKIYAASPVSNFGTSKGKIYPMIRRLATQGFISTRPLHGDSRGTEHLACTERGERAVRTWVMDMRSNHLLLDDPLRTKVQSFDLLSEAEQIEWIAEAKAGLHAKLDELEAYGKDVTVPFQDVVHDNAVSSLRCRLDWLDRLLVNLVRSSRGKE